MTSAVISGNRGDVWITYSGLQDDVETFVLTTQSNRPCRVDIDPSHPAFSAAKKNYYNSILHQQQQHKQQQQQQQQQEPNGQSSWDDVPDSDYDPTRYCNRDAGVTPISSVPVDATYSRGETLVVEYPTQKVIPSNRLVFDGEIRDVPGPGTYNFEDKWQISTKMNAPSFSFPQNDKSQKQPKNPAPGQYHVGGSGHASLKTARAPAYSFGPKLPKSDKTIGPGPGHYHVSDDHTDNTKRTKAPAYSIGVKLNEAEKHVGPGPGKYARDNDIKHKAPAYSMGHKLDKSVVTEGPGPAMHAHSTITSKHKQAPSYTIAARNQEKHHAPGPGPAAYTNAEAQQGKLFSFGTKTQPLKGDNVPGPNAYTSDLGAVKPAAKGFKMGPTFKTQIIKIGPGPAAYYPTEKQAEDAGFSIPARPNTVIQSTGPGPGKYAWTPGPGGPKYSMGAAGERTLVLKTDGPGPALHSVRLNETSQRNGPSAFLIGRPKTKQERDGPGPGTYGIKSEQSHGFTMGSRIDNAENNHETEGPGPAMFGSQIDTNRKKGPSAVLIGLPKTKDAFDTVPGPGAYPVNDSVIRAQQPSVTMGYKRSHTVNKEPDFRPTGLEHDFHSSVGPSFSLGQRLKETKAGADNPGPIYAVNRTNNGSTLQSSKAITIMGRPQQRQVKIESGPGPGQYVVDRTSTGLPLQSTRGTIITGKPIDRPNKYDSRPGPGQYVVDRTSTGKTFKSSKMAIIGGRAKEKPPISDLPGPGQYYVANQSRTTNNVTHGYKMMQPSTTLRTTTKI